MATGHAEASRQFTQPVRQFLTMLIVLGLTGAGTYLALPSVLPVFEANPYLNGVIVGVFAIGVIACFLQVVTLFFAASWIKTYIQDNDTPDQPPRLLLSLATLLRGRGRQKHIASSSARALLDTVGTRIEEARDITRYITNLLIFLGLLGTFFGLATTVPAVVQTIQSLQPSAEESGVEIFGKLMSGLEEQLGGMGTAFASSLLGLAGSLVVGLLELFASHGQNRFYRELEEWLSSITRMTLAGSDGDGASGPGVDLSGLDEVFVALERAVNSLSEQSAGVADRLDVLGGQIAANEKSRHASDAQLAALGTAIDQLARAETARAKADADRAKADAERAKAPVAAAPTAGPTGDEARAQLQTLGRIATGQEQLLAFMRKQAEEAGADAESRMRLRSIDVQLLRILEEMSAGRQDTIAEIRADLGAVAKILRQAARGGAPTDDADGRVRRR